MRKLIQGKAFDTSTAEQLGMWDNSMPRNDFSHCTEILYRTKNGAFFIHGESGPAGKYRETRGQNQWSGGEDIQPMTSSESREWAEGHLSAKEYETIFGEAEEAGEQEQKAREQVTFSLDQCLMIRLRQHAKETGVPMSRMLDRLIAKALDEE